MYGTIAYFSACLTESMMNRLVNEHANSLKDDYEQLREEITSSEETSQLKEQYSNNLKKAYQAVLNETSQIVEIEEVMPMAE